MSQHHNRNSNDKRKMKAALFAGCLSKPCCFCRKVLFMSTATLEHVIPLSSGGSWKKDNLRLSCEHCNAQRKTEDFETFQRRKRGIGVEHKVS